MKTKRKAICRDPFVSCSPSSDLYPAVQHTECYSETSKKKKSVCESIGTTSCSRNMETQRTDMEPTRIVHVPDITDSCSSRSKRPNPDTYEHATLRHLPPAMSSQLTMSSSSVSRRKSNPKRVAHPQIRATSSPTATQAADVDPIRRVEVQNITHGCNNRSKRARFMQDVTPSSASRDKKRSCLENAEVNAHTQVNTSSSSVSRRKSNPKRVRYPQIRATSSPTGAQDTHMDSTRRVQLDNSTDGRNNRSKRARFTQGPPATYVPLGKCDQVCRHCKALFWYDERTKGRNSRYVDCFRCCNNGKVVLPPTKECPQYIKRLFEDRQFMENVRAYNQMFAMTSLGAEVEDAINRGRGPYVFKVSGKIYHWIGSMCPASDALDKRPKFLQLYIYDTAHEVDNRLEHFNKGDSRLNREIVEKLKEILDTHNELVKLFRTARDKIEDSNIPDFKLKLFGVVGSRQHDLPTGDSIGAIVFEGGPDFCTEYDVVIEKRDGQPQQIDKLNPHYMSLHFPLLFIHGEVGYHLGLKLLDKAGIPIQAPPTNETKTSITVVEQSKDSAETGTHSTPPKPEIQIEQKPTYLQANAKTNVKTETRATPMEEQFDITETSTTKDEQKSTKARRALFQDTKAEAVTPTAKKSKKND
ncbi:hypothetical protein CTI12_AA357350 [Artemisia annua]|uniref:Helitron helicase-like domain-containing protein n=1 Tax=Artemisia annua TaxID=35608 RepID=A0A2U1MPG9_ARTAN|nr:hypothetical protein CTI12_AA357350 [Artemisia annua]